MPTENGRIYSIDPVEAFERENMRALLIDPVAKTVTETEVTGATDHARLQSLYALLKCDMVERVQIALGVDLWVDEEGLNREPVQPSWAFRAALNRPFVGRGLILSSKGEDIAATDYPVDSLAKAIVFE
jgi:hypothetical protein